MGAAPHLHRQAVAPRDLPAVRRLAAPVSRTSWRTSSPATSAIRSSASSRRGLAFNVGLIEGIAVAASWHGAAADAAPDGQGDARRQAHRRRTLAHGDGAGLLRAQRRRRPTPSPARSAASSLDTRGAAKLEALYRAAGSERGWQRIYGVELRRRCATEWPTLVDAQAVPPPSARWRSSGSAPERLRHVVRARAGAAQAGGAAGGAGRRSRARAGRVGGRCAPTIPTTPQTQADGARRGARRRCAAPRARRSPSGCSVAATSTASCAATPRRRSAIWRCSTATSTRRARAYAAAAGAADRRGARACSTVKRLVAAWPAGPSRADLRGHPGRAAGQPRRDASISVTLQKLARPRSRPRALPLSARAAALRRAAASPTRPTRSARAAAEPAARRALRPRGGARPRRGARSAWGASTEARAIFSRAGRPTPTPRERRASTPPTGARAATSPRRSGRDPARRSSSTPTRSACAARRARRPPARACSAPRGEVVVTQHAGRAHQRRMRRFAADGVDAGRDLRRRRHQPVDRDRAGARLRRRAAAQLRHPARRHRQHHRRRTSASAARPTQLLRRLARAARGGHAPDASARICSRSTACYGFLFASLMGARFLEAYYGGRTPGVGLGGAAGGAHRRLVAGARAASRAGCSRPSPSSSPSTASGCRPTPYRLLLASMVPRRRHRHAR